MSAKATATLYIRLSSELRDRIVAAAAKNEVTLNNEVTTRLYASFERDADARRKIADIKKVLGQ